MTRQDRRDNMQGVCRQCHGKTFVEGACDQFDGVVVLYNEKFARPARTIMEELKKRELITPRPCRDAVRQEAGSNPLPETER